MNKVVWEAKQSVPLQTSLQKAWEFHIKIEENWKRVEGDSVEYIKLSGPYEAGTKGTTKMKGQPPVEWQLIKVVPFSQSVTEYQLPDARIHFEFTFEKLSESQTVMTQRISLAGDGDGAEQYIPMMQENFGKNLEAGMKKVAEEMGKDN